MSPTRVFIVDDHEVVREGLRTVLKKDPAMSIVGMSEDTVDLVKKLKKAQADVVILDISMPNRSGLDALKDLRQLYPKTRVLILSMHPEERFAVRAFRAGASGYLNKQTAGEELIKAIQRIKSGRKYVSAGLAEQLAEELDHKSSSQLHTDLSDREFDVMRLIAMGEAASDIAKKLHLSVNTVSTYRTRILEKMRVKTTAELTRYALEHRLID